MHSPNDLSELFRGQPMEMVLVHTPVAESQWDIGGAAHLLGDVI